MKNKINFVVARIATIILCLNIMSCEKESPVHIDQLWIQINDDLYLNTNKIDLIIGTTGTFIAPINGSHDADYVPNYTWISSDSSILEVDEKSGKYVTKSIGKCKLTLTNVDVSYKVNYFVNVIPLDVTDISLKDTEKTLLIGEEFILQATITPLNATYKNIEWSSSDPSVASVDSVGKVRAIKEGNCTIVANTSNDKSAKCEVVVVPTEVEGISLDVTEKSLLLGEEFTLNATVTPENATYKDVEWSSSDPSVASVDSDGKVRAIKEGNCIIVAKAANGKSAKCKVMVLPVAVESISLDVTEKSLLLGEEFTLNATVTPENATYKDVEWSSSDPSVASVDSDGKVRAIKEGNCIIVAKAANGKSAKCKVMVLPIAVESISLDVTEKSLLLGEEFTLNATVTPENATYKDVEWSSSESSVASVDSDGKVRAIKEGTCTISVRSSNNLVAECKVIVRYIEVENVRLNLEDKTLEEGETFTLTATITPDNATYKDVEWSSSDPSIASVDVDGNVTALKVGECYIYARSSNKEAQCRVTVKPVSVKEVKFAKATMKLLIGESMPVEYEVLPSNAIITDIQWKIDDSSIASVSTDGVVVCNGEGTTTLTAIINGEYSAECKIEGCTIEDFVSLRFGSSAISSVNGYITGQIQCNISNNSSQEITVKSIQLIDSESGRTYNEMSTDNAALKANSSLGYVISINYPMYKPIFRWKYIHNDNEYIIEKVFDK